MAQSISILGLAASDPVPGLYADLRFGAGVATGSGASRTLVLMGNMLSTGSATVDSVEYGPDTAVQLATESDAIALFGSGSELHRMYRRAAGSNPVTPIYAVAVTESVGSKASATLTLSGTATSAGSLRVWVCGEFVDVGFITGDGYAAVGDLAVTAINAHAEWPVTASHTTGSASLVLTAKQRGLRGNWLRYGAQVIPSTCGISVSPTSFGFMTGVTTADSNTAALATLATKNHYYQVSAAEDVTQFDALSDQIATMQEPITGIRQRCFAGSVDTISNVITVATTVNNPRAEIVWLAQSDVPPSELAALAASAYALEEASTVPLCNFNGYGGSARTASHWPVRRPLSQAAPTRAQVKSALNNGVTPVQVSSNGSTSIVRRITSYSLNGSNQDLRVRDTCKVTVPDFWTDDFLAIVASVIEGKNIANDPVDQEPVPANCVTPRDIKILSNKLVRDYAANGLIDNPGEVIANTICIREANPSNRISILIPLRIGDIVNQIGIRVEQVS